MLESVYLLSTNLLMVSNYFTGNTFTDILATTSFFFFAVSLLTLLSFVLLFLNYFLASYPKYMDKNTLLPYECGFEPMRSVSNNTYNMHFFRLALLFLVFDLELLYMYPGLTALFDLTFWSNKPLLIMVFFFFFFSSWNSLWMFF